MTETNPLTTSKCYKLFLMGKEDLNQEAKKNKFWTKEMDFTMNSDQETVMSGVICSLLLDSALMEQFQGG